MVEAAEAAEAEPLSLEDRPKRREFHARDYDWKREFPRGEWWYEDVPGMLEQLSPRQWTAVAARVRGKTKADTGRLVGTSADRINGWEQCPWWDAAADQERTKLFGDKMGPITPRIPAALQRIDDEIAGRHGPDIAHQSAIWLLEQAWGKPQQSVQKKIDGAEAGVGATIVEVLRALAAQREQGRLEAPKPQAEAEVIDVGAGDARP